jgi:(2Fe-2S) ferredoxin
MSCPLPRSTPDQPQEAIEGGSPLPYQPPCLLVCQNRTCHQQGSAAVLAAFQERLPATWQVSGCGCLGQCGNGPMVLVLPDQIWYSAVSVPDVAQIVQHLQRGQVVAKLLYPKFHPTLPPNSVLRIFPVVLGIGIITLVLSVAGIGLWILGHQSPIPAVQ